jgi:hypothetical protein
MHPRTLAIRQAAASKRIVEAVNKLAEKQGLEERATAEETDSPEVTLLLRTELAADMLEVLAAAKPEKTRKSE